MVLSTGLRTIQKLKRANKIQFHVILLINHKLSLLNCNYKRGGYNTIQHISINRRIETRHHSSYIDRKDVNSNSPHEILQNGSNQNKTKTLNLSIFSEVITMLHMI